MISDTQKILRINTYIQRDHGVVSLEGEAVMVVSLDRTFATYDAYDPERILTDAQLDNLFNQTLRRDMSMPPHNINPNGHRRYTGTHPASVRAGDHILHDQHDCEVQATGQETVSGWAFWVKDNDGQHRVYYRRGEVVMVRQLESESA